MPSSAVRTFTDPDDYAAAIRQGTYELTVTERGDFTAKLTRIDLHRLWMQRFSDNLPRISHVAGWGGRAVIAFRTQPGPSLLSSGVEMQPTNIVRYSEGQSYFRQSSGLACYGSMSLPVEEIAIVAEAMAACDLTPPRDPMLVTPPAAGMARLQRLHAAAGHLAEEAPEIIANPDAARGLEQALHRGDGRLPRGSTGAWKQPGAGAARDRNAPVSQAGGRKSGAATLHPRDMQGDPGGEPDVADVLPGAFGDGAKALFAAAPDASGAAGAARGRARCSISDGHCDALRLLAVRALRRRIPVPVRRVSVRHTSPKIRVAAASFCRNCIVGRKIGRLRLTLGQGLPGHPEPHSETVP
jgi:hypothetical protein